MIRRIKAALVAVALAVPLWVTSARAEDPAPYKGIEFQWEYGDYAACAGFNIYREGVAAPVLVVSDRKARTVFAPMAMTIGESMCFTMEAFDAQGNKSEMSEQSCVVVPLPGVKMFLAFPGAGR